MKACTPYQLPVANGVVDLTTGRLMPGQSSDELRGGSPVAYHEDATCPLWESFLSQALGLSDPAASRSV
ncbi:hypothetical protein [Solidesulfovibrio sp.]